MHEKISKMVKEHKNLSNSQSFVDLIKGKREIPFPESKPFILLDSEKQCIESVHDYKIKGKYFELSTEIILSKSYKDILIFLTNINSFSIICDNNHISCKINGGIEDMFIFQFDYTFVFIQSTNKTFVYRLINNKKIEKYCNIEFPIQNIIQVKDKPSFFCFTEDEGMFKIYIFEYINMNFIYNEVIQYNIKPEDFKDQRLFLLGDTLYFNRLNVLINVFGHGPAIFGEEAYSIGEGILVSEFITNKTVLRYIINLEESKLKFKGIFKKLVKNDLIIIHNEEKIIFITISNKKLKIIKKIDFRYNEFDILDTEVLFKKKQIEIVHFVNRKTNINENEKVLQEKIKSLNLRDDSLNNLIQSSENNILTPEKQVAKNMENDETLKNTIKSEEQNNSTSTQQEEVRESVSEPTDMNHISTTNDQTKNCFNTEIDRLNKKMDYFYLKIENDKKIAEQENKIKFKKLLDTISLHLNENLVTSVEMAIRREVKSGILQIKKSVSDGLYNLENKTTEFMNFTSEKQAQTIQMPSSDDLVKVFQTSLINDVLPVIESCFEELKIQMLEEIKSNNELKFSGQTGVTISLKDEILNLLNNDKVIEASLIALDGEDDIFLFYVENMTTNLIEKLTFEIQNELLKTSTGLYEQTLNEELCKFVSNILMTLELHDLNIAELNLLKSSLNLIENANWKEDEKMKLMLAMQRNQIKRALNKKK